MNIEIMQKKLWSLEAKKELYTKQIKVTSLEIQTAAEDMQAIDLARDIVKKAAAITQQNLILHLSELVTECIQSILDREYVFQIIISERGGSSFLKTCLECNGKQYDPMEDNGGTVVDIVAFAMRIACLILDSKNSRLFMLLDEPFRNVSRDLQPFVADLIHRLSDELGIQFVIITHELDIIPEHKNIHLFEVEEGMVLRNEG